MPQTRKKVRDALRAVLAHSATGFNAQLSALASTYGITAFAVDWNASSTSVLQAYIRPEQVEISQLDNTQSSSPLVVLIYTTNAQNEGREHPTKFSGTITAVVEFIIQFRAGVELDDIESITDAIEDAAIECIYADAAAWSARATPSQFYSVPKEPAQLLADGWRQTVSIFIPFKVTAL